MFWKKGFMLFGVLFLLFVVLNFIARKKMPYSYADLPGYDQLYMVKEQLRIAQVTENKDHSVTIAFSGKGVRENNDYKVYHDSVLLATASSPKLTFKPLNGANNYLIKLNDIAGFIAIDLNYAADSVFISAGNSGAGGSELTGSSIPVEESPLYSIDDWAWQFNKFEADNNKAASYLKDSMKIAPGDNAMTRVVKIAQFILQRTKGMDGTPSDTMTKLSPIDQLKYAQAGRSKMWCGIYTAIFSWFAHRAGVPARFIQCSNSRLNISSGVHVFNEVYIEEYGGWLYVDLLAKTIFVKKGEKYLNVTDVHRLLKYNIDDPSLVACYFNGDSIVQKPFNQVAAIARYYFHRNNSFSFYFNDYWKMQSPRNLIERGKNVFYTKPYYALYGDNIGTGRSQLIFRLITTYAMIVFLGLCLIAGYKFYKQKRA